MSAKAHITSAINPCRQKIPYKNVECTLKIFGCCMWIGKKIESALLLVPLEHKVKYVKVQDSF